MSSVGKHEVNNGSTQWESKDEDHPQEFHGDISTTVDDLPEKDDV